MIEQPYLDLLMLRLEQRTQMIADELCFQLRRPAAGRHSAILGGHNFILRTQCMHRHSGLRVALHKFLQITRIHLEIFL
jgi:hypothetical protein